MTGTDISWRGPGGTFNLRVAAVISRGDNVLVCTVGRLGYWFLPGGRVRLGESSEAALTRELAEELGHELPGGKLALVAENIYLARTLEHEIGLYYRLSWPEPLAEDDLAGGTEPGHTFRWVPLAGLGAERFEPAGLVPVLQNLGEDLRHVVLSRRGGG